MVTLKNLTSRKKEKRVQLKTSAIWKGTSLRQVLVKKKRRLTIKSQEKMIFITNSKLNKLSLG